MHAGPGLLAPLRDWLDLHPHHQSPSTDLTSVPAQTLTIVNAMIGQASLV